MIPHKRLLFKFIFLDILAALLVWVAFVIFRKYINDIPIPEFFVLNLPDRYYINSLIFFPLVCVFVHSLTGYYLELIYKSKVNIFVATFVSSLIIAIAVFSIFKLGDAAISFRYFYFSLTILFTQLFVITYVLRMFLYRYIQNNLKSKKWTINTIIIGNGENAISIAEELRKDAITYNLVGAVSVLKHHRSHKELHIIGTFYDIADLISSYNISQIIVALDDDVAETELFKIINQLYQYDVDISFTPRLYEILIGSARIGKLGINPLVSITQVNMPDWQISIKRYVDLILSFIGLILMLPLFAYLAIRIRYDSKGSIFFLQERIGRHGKPFNIVKFRTMYTNAEGGKPQLSSAFDNRITPFGRILRKYRLDELPQFWNILKGDMSFVGPRPERQYYIDKIIKEAPYYCLLYKIRPGLTSWGPIKVGYTDTIEKMIERLNYDIIYIENMSLLNDLKIFLLTFEILFKGEGM